MDPGSAIQFVTTRAGWRVDGQDASNHLDEHLASGPIGENFDWPGLSVSSSTDGGRTWTTRYTSTSGIWGIDFLSAATGWVVAVTSLEHTTDGGLTWVREGEPSPHPLVSVDFVTSRLGYGLTGSGQLMSTADSGAVWSPVRLAVAGGALCFASPQTGYVSGQDGAVWRTTDGGSAWVMVHASPFASNQIRYLPWSWLGCDGGDVWQGLQAIPAIPGGGTPYVVLFSGTAGRTWSVVAASRAPQAVAWPHAPDPVSQLAGLSLGASYQGILAGFPGSGWDLDVVRAAGATEAGRSGPTVQLASLGKVVPPISAAMARATSRPAAASDIIVHGLSFAGSYGWIFFDDSAVGSVNETKSESILMGTTDAGASWSILGISSKHSY